MADSCANSNAALNPRNRSGHPPRGVKRGKSPNYLKITLRGKSRKASRDVHRGKKTGKSSIKYPPKNKDPHRNMGVARHRPKTQFAGQRIGEADHPGPCHATNCRHENCTRFGHHHRPGAQQGAKKRLTEKKKKNGSSKPARWTVCTVHLEAGKCGVDKPHGHCTCSATTHYHDMLHEYAGNVTAHSPSSPMELMDALENERHQEREAELTRVVGGLDFILTEHEQLVAQSVTKTVEDVKRQEICDALLIDEPYDPGTEMSDPPDWGSDEDEDGCYVPKHRVAATPLAEPDEDKHNTPPNPNGDDTPASSDFNTPTEGVPSADENKESLTDESSSDESDCEWIEKMEAMIEEFDKMLPKSAKTKPITEKLQPELVELQRMHVFFNAQVGEENLSIYDRLTNWFKRHIPLSKLEETTLVNAASANLFSESLQLLPTNVDEVQAFWQRSDQGGAAMAQATGTLALFRELLPACMEVEVYKKILDDAAVDPKLNKQGVVTRDLQISSALGPIVTDYVFTQASKFKGCYDNPTLLQWTVVAIMNQLTATALVRRMAGNAGGMDFRTRGRSRTTRL